MKASLNWLKEYVDITVSVEKLASELTKSGIEVEGIARLADRFDGFVVGRVLEVNSHPNASNLTICKVDIGKETLQIVCGAPNVAPNQKVAVAMVGATIPRSARAGGKSARLEASEIRGVVSAGMICSSYELDIDENHEGILVLGQNARVGSPLAKALGVSDTVLEIAVTPNRPDLLGHIGLAREIAALLGKPLRMPEYHVRGSLGKEVAKPAISISIKDPKLCPRYSAYVVRNVTVGPSPKWMQDRLAAVGFRPINNLVDVTNYVLMEYGHPLHAFDLDRLRGPEIIVRRAADGSEFETLDGKRRRLNSDVLLICDRKGPIAIAGVMGGANSEITSTTHNILIESAYFSPQNIRRTSKFLGLSTESSLRFERGADPNITATAAERAVRLIIELAGGVAVQPIIDIRSGRMKSKTIQLRVGRTNSLLGTSLTRRDISKLLAPLEVKVLTGRKSDEMSCVVPTFRPDLEREIDLIEEIARRYGYDRIDAKMKSTISFTHQPILRPIEELLRDWLVGAGFREVITNSMVGRSLVDLPSENIVDIRNPLSAEMSSMRTSLLPSLMQVVAHNINRGRKDLRLFELGRVYWKEPSPDGRVDFGDYHEEDRLAIAITGRAAPIHWDLPERLVDLLDLKGEVDALLRKIFLDKFDFIYYSTTNTLTEENIGVEINGTYAGYLGRVSQRLKKQFDLSQDIFACELRSVVLRASLERSRRFENLPRFPAVERDVAFIVDEGQRADELESTILRSGGPLLQGVKLFDLYFGENIGRGKKSCAFSLEFRSLERTLTDAEVDEQVKQIVEVMRRRFGAVLRST